MSKRLIVFCLVTVVLQTYSCKVKPVTYLPQKTYWSNFPTAIRWKGHYQEVKGLVLDVFENPIKGALVEVFTRPELLTKDHYLSLAERENLQDRIGCTYSDSHGIFHVKDVKLGVYEIRTSKPGYTTNSLLFFIVNPDRKTDGEKVVVYLREEH